MDKLTDFCTPEKGSDLHYVGCLFLYLHFIRANWTGLIYKQNFHCLSQWISGEEVCS